MKTRKMIRRKNTASALSAVLTIICPGFSIAHDTELTPIVVTANPIIDRVRIDGFSSTSAVVTESQLTANQAEAILEREPVDLVVLDLNMPHRTGYDVIRTIRGGARQPALPILVLTGSIDERETSGSLGADVLLTKPTDLRRLVTEIRALLARPTSARE